MKHAQLIQAAFFACLAMGQDDPSVREIAAMTGRIRAGKPVWHEAVRQWKASRSDTPPIRDRHASDTAAPLKNEENDTVATQERTPRAHVAKVLESQASLFAIAQRTAAEKPKKPVADWTIPLRVAVSALNDRDLETLKPDELHLLARFHALEFAGCRTNEATNKRRAANGISIGIRWLIDRWIRTGRMITVADYIAAGRKHVGRTGGAPWYTPRDLETEIIFAPQPKGADQYGQSRAYR